MPYSYGKFDNSISELLRATFNTETPILDVGPGAGKFRELLAEYPFVDCLEIYEGYVEKFRLEKRYHQVFVADVTKAGPLVGYKLVIFGDVLEHLTVEDAQEVLRTCFEAGQNVLVAVPYLYEQEGCEQFPDNQHEKHLQPDLTPDVMAERYPNLHLVLSDDTYGVYVFGPDFTAKIGQAEIDWERLKGYHLYVGTPTTGSMVNTSYVNSLIRLQDLAHRSGLPRVNFAMFDGASVEKARNMIVATFLNDPTATHLLFMDSDQAFRPMDIMRLMNFNRDVVGIAVRLKKMNPEWNVNFLAEDVLVEDGAVEVKEMGTGCMLIKREVLLKLIAAHPELKVIKMDEGTKAPEFMYNLFTFSVQNGHYIGEDYGFCRMWRNLGGRLWLDPNGVIGHIGRYVYQGAISSIFEESVDADKAEGPG